MFLLLSRWIPPSEERVISAKIGGRPVEPFTYSQLAQALVDHMKKLLSDFAANVGDYHDDSLFADPSKRDACLAAQRALEDLFEGPKPYSKLLKANGGLKYHLWSPCRLHRLLRSRIDRN